MTPHKRFFIGGGGALMPVLVSFLAIDIGAALSNEANLTTPNIIGIAIRYVILFIVGGVVAYLHEDENKPFKLFELGIAAPALITSLITAQGVVANTSNSSSDQASSVNISLIGSAHASSGGSSENIVLAGGFLSDLLRGAGGGIYRDIGKSADRAHQPVEKVVEKAVQDTGKTVEKAAHDTGSALEKAAKDTEVEASDTTPDLNDTEKEKKLLRIKAEAARAKALAESEKANAALLKAEAARAKAEALEKEYQASLAMAKAAEAQAIAAEQEINLFEGSGEK